MNEKAMNEKSCEQKDEKWKNRNKNYKEKATKKPSQHQVTAKSLARPFETGKRANTPKP